MKRLIDLYQESNNDLLSLVNKRYIKINEIITKRKEVDLQITSINIMCRFGQNQFNSGNYEKAESMFNEAFVLLMEINDFDTIGYLNLLIRILNKIKDCNEQLKRYEIVNIYDEIIKNCYTNYKDKDLQNELVDLYLKKCEKIIVRSKENVKTKYAETHLLKVIEKRESLTLDYQNLCALANDYSLISDIYASIVHMNNPEKAIDFYLKEINLRHKIYTLNDCFENLESLCISYSEVANCYRRIMQYDQFEIYIDKAIENGKILNQLYKRESTLNKMAYYYESKSNYYLEIKNDISTAIEYKQQALTYFQELLKIDHLAYLEDVERCQKSLVELSQKL